MATGEDGKDKEDDSVTKKLDFSAKGAESERTVSDPVPINKKRKFFVPLFSPYFSFGIPLLIYI